MHAANAGHDVRLLGRRGDVVERLRATRQHPALKGAPPIPERVRITTDPAEAFPGAAAVLWSVSVQATAAELARLKDALPAVAARRDVEGDRDRDAPPDDGDHDVRDGPDVRPRRPLGADVRGRGRARAARGRRRRVARSGGLRASCRGSCRRRRCASTGRATSSASRSRARRRTSSRSRRASWTA